LLRAPLVDSVFFKRFGKRKSWIVPISFLIGVLMISLAHVTNKLVQTSQTQSEIFLLAIIFFMITFLVATQDVAIDGWSISLLSEQNVHWQSICTSVGQTLGYYVGNTLFVLLQSAKFCNNNLRPFFGLSSQPHGILNMRGL
jgi:PAT family acetyl-CoA transporter-like MFS transporter 1